MQMACMQHWRGSVRHTVLKFILQSIRNAVVYNQHELAAPARKQLFELSDDLAIQFKLSCIARMQKTPCSMLSASNKWGSSGTGSFGYWQ